MRCRAFLYVQDGHWKKEKEAAASSEDTRRCSFFFVLLFCCLDDFFAIVIAAFRAYVMRHFRLMALRASCEARSRQFPVCTALIATGLGSFALWYCHLMFTSESENPSVKSMQWVDADGLRSRESCDFDTYIYDSRFCLDMQGKFYFFDRDSLFLAAGRKNRIF